MGKRESYEAKTTELIQPVVEANGVELFDVDYEIGRASCRERV